MGGGEGGGRDAERNEEGWVGERRCWGGGGSEKQTVGGGGWGGVRETDSVGVGGGANRNLEEAWKVRQGELEKNIKHKDGGCLGGGGVRETDSWGGGVGGGVRETDSWGVGGGGK